MAYNYDYKQSILNFISHNPDMSFRAVGRIFNVSYKTIILWKKHGIESRQKGKRNNVKLDMKALESYILSHPDSYQKEVGEVFGVHQSTICQALKRLKITRKKKTLETLDKINLK